MIFSLASFSVQVASLEQLQFTIKSFALLRR